MKAIRVTAYIIFVLFSSNCKLISTRPSAQSEPLSIVLIGPPASGKGTQSMRLSHALNLVHISTGDLFRDNIKNQTKLGQSASKYINEGKLVPDEITVDMLFARVSKSDCALGYILDGFPRTVEQAQALNKRLPNQHFVVLNLDVPDSVVLERVVDRRSCPHCKNIHNIKFSPPKNTGLCDKCS